MRSMVAPSRPEIAVCACVCVCERARVYGMCVCMSSPGDKRGDRGVASGRQPATGAGVCLEGGRRGGMRDFDCRRYPYVRACMVPSRPEIAVCACVCVCERARVYGMCVCMLSPGDKRGDRGVASGRQAPVCLASWIDIGLLVRRSDCRCGLVPPMWWHSSADLYVAGAYVAAPLSQYA